MTTALDRILTTPLKATERGGMSSVRVAADSSHVATISAGMNDQPEYARLFAAAPDLFAIVTRYLATYPAFRIMPVGSPGSERRAEQEAQIELEDDARAIIAKMGRPGS